jgi:DNA polymerase-3 subunit gamma/tau
MARQAERLDMVSLLRAIRAFNTAANDARGGWQPQLPLELAMVECVTAPAQAALPAAAVTPAVAAAAPAARPTSRGTPAITAAPEPAAARPARTEPKRAPERVEAPASTAASARAPAREPKAAAVTEAAAPDEAGPMSGGTRSAAELKSDWTRFVHLMRERDKVNGALLNSCTVLGLEGQVLRLATNEFVHKKISSNSQVLEVMDSLLGEVLGFTCTVRFEVSGRAARSSRADAIPEDGLVATALDLGGEIVDDEEQ